MPEMAQIFTEESCMPSRRLLINFQLSRQYWVHVWAIWGSWFGYFYNIFASRFLKLFKFSQKNHACYIEECSLMFNFWDHIWAMFGPYQANVLTISIVSLLLRTLIMLVNGYFGVVIICNLGGNLRPLVLLGYLFKFMSSQKFIHHFFRYSCDSKCHNVKQNTAEATLQKDMD